jgi:uncharacterized protein YraI
MHLRKRFAGVAALFAALLFPTIASAATAYSTTDVNMRVGPGTDYPIITTIYAGEPVTIYGCLFDWSWCDIGWYGDRGWVRGDYLDVVYESRHVYLPDYAPLVGLTVIVFSFNDYWDVHYHDRPWYRDRDRWRDHWLHNRDARAHFRDRRDTREDGLQIREERREDARGARREERPAARRDRREDQVETRRDRRSDREVRRGSGDNRPAARQDRRSDRQVRRGHGDNRPAARRDRREDRLHVQRDRREVGRDRRATRDGPRGGDRGGGRCRRPGAHCR